MFCVAKIIENNDFRTVNLHLSKKSYYIKISEKEIDEELLKKGYNPIQQRLYASPKHLSRNIIAQDLAEEKLLNILECEILGMACPDIEYETKNAEDWDSIQAHTAKLNESVINGQNALDTFWNGADKKYMMINGKYVEDETLAKRFRLGGGS